MSIQPGPNTGGIYPSILTSGTTFYKYEPFSFTFTGGSSFTASGTLVSYCSAPGGASITFSSVAGFQTTSSPTGETLVISSTAGSVTYTLFINGGRFVLTPAISSVILYQNEPVSTTVSTALGITFTSQTRLCNTYTVPSLPSSALTLTNPSLDGFNFVLAGAPTFVSASSNYYFIGSNSSNGYIVTTSFPIQVKAERMVMSPTTAAVQLVIGSSTPSSNFTVTVPLTATGIVTFSLSNAPPGVSLVSSNVTVVNYQATATLTGIPTLPPSGITSYVTTLTASVTALNILTSTSTITFGYLQTLIYNAQSTNFYSNITGSYQILVKTFPILTPVTFSPSNPAPGLTLSTSGLLTGKVISTVGLSIMARANGGVSNIQTVSVTAIAVPITITSSVPSISLYIGQPLPTITITFSSAAYATGVNFIAPDGVTVSGLPPGIVFTWNYPSLTATLTGTPLPPSSTGNISISVSSIDGATGNKLIAYTINADSASFFTVASASFAFAKNVPITPIQIYATTTSSLSISSYFSDISIPGGLIISPGGILEGTPTTATSTTLLTGLFATTGASFSTFPVLSTNTYSVSEDAALLRSSPTATAITAPLPAAVSIDITSQTLSGTQLSLTPMVIPSYSYGLTASPVSISGTLGACVYGSNSIVLPSNVLIAGTLSPNDIPTVFGLSNSNPQVINRFIVGYNNGLYHVLNDFGTGTFTSLYSAATTTPGIHSIQIISNVAPSAAISSWTGSLLIVDGSSALARATGDPGAPLGLQFAFSPYVLGAAVCSAYSTTLSLWFVYSPNNRFGYSSTGTSWTDMDFGGDTPAQNVNGQLPVSWIAATSTLRVYGNKLLLGGSSTPFSTSITCGTLPSSGVPTSRVNFASVTGLSLTKIYDIAVGPTRVVAAGEDGTHTLQYSTDGLAWVSSSAIFSTNAYNVVYGNLIVGWLALGYNSTNPGVAWSSDGITWSLVNFGFTTADMIGPAQFDGTYWCFIKKTAGVFTLYQHDALVSTITTSSSWTVSRLSLPIGLTLSVINSFPKPIYTLSGSPQPVIYAGITPTGPIFEQQNTLYQGYQYVDITPIVFKATGTNVSYFLLSSLPPGMFWTVTATEGTITGRSVKLGTFTITVYAVGTNGISTQQITIVVSRAQITLKTPTAGSYISSIREKVIADSATSAINDHVTPFEVGPFLLERPPTVTTAPELCWSTTPGRA